MAGRADEGNADPTVDVVSQLVFGAITGYLLVTEGCTKEGQNNTEDRRTKNDATLQSVENKGTKRLILSYEKISTLQSTIIYRCRCSFTVPMSILITRTKEKS